MANKAAAFFFRWSTNFCARAASDKAKICTARKAAFLAPALPIATVATVAIGKAGARNAAFLAVQILALSDAALAQKLVDQRKKNAAALLAKNENL